MFELNVKVDNKNDFKVIHKLLYKAASDQTWGEYECNINAKHNTHVMLYIFF